MFHYVIQWRGLAQDIWKDVSSRIRAGIFEWVRRESSRLELVFPESVLVLPSEHCELGQQLLEADIVSTKNNKTFPALKKI